MHTPHAPTPPAASQWQVYCSRHADYRKVSEHTHGMANNVQGRMLSVLHSLRSWVHRNYADGVVPIKEAQRCMATSSERRTVRRRLAILEACGVAFVRGDALVMPGYFSNPADRRRGLERIAARRAQVAEKQARYRAKKAVQPAKQKWAPCPLAPSQVPENSAKISALPHQKQPLGRAAVSEQAQLADKGPGLHACEKQPFIRPHRARIRPARRMVPDEITAIEAIFLGPPEPSPTPAAGPACQPDLPAKTEPVAKPDEKAKAVSRKRGKAFPGPDDPCWHTPCGSRELERGCALMTPDGAALARYQEALALQDGMGARCEPVSPGLEATPPRRTGAQLAKQGGPVSRRRPEQVPTQHDSLVTRRWVREHVNTVPGLEGFDPSWVIASGVHVGSLRVAVEQVCVHRHKFKHPAKTVTKNAIRYETRAWKVYAAPAAGQVP